MAKKVAVKKKAEPMKPMAGKVHRGTGKTEPAPVKARIKRGVMR